MLSLSVWYIASHFYRSVYFLSWFIGHTGSCISFPRYSLCIITLLYILPSKLQSSFLRYCIASYSNLVQCTLLPPRIVHSYFLPFPLSLFSSRIHPIRVCRRHTSFMTSILSCIIYRTILFLPFRSCNILPYPTGIGIYSPSPLTLP